jgi:hypothetical protein
VQPVTFRCVLLIIKAISMLLAEFRYVRGSRSMPQAEINNNDLQFICLSIHPSIRPSDIRQSDALFLRSSPQPLNWVSSIDRALFSG